MTPSVTAGLPAALQSKLTKLIRKNGGEELCVQRDQITAVACSKRVWNVNRPTGTTFGTAGNTHTLNTHTH